ncbi:hypothetical protein [Flammeovirga sp. SubArs3]|uniref:hypothetical protein n=1 Tax=Flammeovirga sp. SubArs3 TaxID=2995316 RepID=UPI00248B5B9C|nr:hypothetical protein [Flammeovirga sp. SubArs3]
MKKRFYLLLLFLGVVSLSSYAQNKLNVGAAYYGETIFHPGFSINGEYEISLSESWSLPLRATTGYYFHKRNHQAVFLEITPGIRWHFGQTKRWYMSGYGGIGAMSSWHHSDDGIYEVNDNGNVSKKDSNYAGTSLTYMTSVDFGYQISKERPQYLWVRPRMTWQTQVNQQSLYHLAVEIGYSITLN